MLASRAAWRRLSRGEFLFHAGEPARRLFVIVSGRVAAKVTSKEGTPLLFYIAGAGEVAGQVEVLTGGNYTASAQALSEVTAVAVQSEAVADLLESEPSLLLTHARQLAAIIASLTESMSDLVFLDLEHRLARVLISGATNGAAFDIEMTQGDLAARLGVARQSVNSALGRLSGRRLIEVQSGRIIRIVDRPALVAFADHDGR